MTAPALPKLSEQQRRFVDAYLILPNGTRAAETAGYSTRSGNCRSTATRLLADPSIRQHLLVAREERSERVQIDADWVLLQLAEYATTDLIDLFDDDGNPLPLREMSDSARKLISGIDIDQRVIESGGERRVVSRTAKLRLINRLDVIREIGRHVNVNAFRDNIALQSADELAKRIVEARDRARLAAKNGAEVGHEVVLEMEE